MTEEGVYIITSNIINVYKIGSTSNMESRIKHYRTYYGDNIQYKYLASVNPSWVISCMCRKCDKQKISDKYNLFIKNDEFTLEYYYNSLLECNASLHEELEREKINDIKRHIFNFLRYTIPISYQYEEKIDKWMGVRSVLMIYNVHIDEKLYGYYKEYLHVYHYEQILSSLEDIESFIRTYISCDETIPCARGRKVTISLKNDIIIYIISESILNAILSMTNNKDRGKLSLYLSMYRSSDVSEYNLQRILDLIEDKNKIEARRLCLCLCEVK